MKAVTWHDVGDIRFEDVPEPTIQHTGDAIVRVTTSAICGTDLHMVRGTMPGMRPGSILGHEGVGVVESVGDQVRNFQPGDRVVIPSTIACGSCAYCRAGYFSQCDSANPGGHLAGTAFYGGPEDTGPFDGLQAEYARVPYANVNLVPLPDDVSDAVAITLSDIFPTGWFGAQLAEIEPGDTVAVFGAGPVGQLAIASAQVMRAGRVLAVDGVETRLDLARRQHAEVIDFNREDPVEVIRDLTGGIGVDRVIEAVGVDAQHPIGSDDPGFEAEREAVAPRTGTRGDTWVPGDAPSQASRWSVDAVCKAGTIGVVGVYPRTMTSWPIGAAMNKNLTVKMGNCNHRKYIPELIELVRAGTVEPARVLTQVEPFPNAVDAYQTFDRREAGWVKVALALAA